jgi:hypothetical protein
MPTPIPASEAHKVAEQHLEKVQASWDDPTDWSDLTLYGFYCLEAAVVAAATHAGITMQRSHPVKLQAAQTLHSQHGLPDIQQLLIDLNMARKATAYGDEQMPSLDAEDLAAAIEDYVSRVGDFLKK